MIIGSDSRTILQLRKTKKRKPHRAALNYSYITVPNQPNQAPSSTKLSRRASSSSSSSSFPYRHHITIPMQNSNYNPSSSETPDTLISKVRLHLPPPVAEAPDLERYFRRIPAISRGDRRPVVSTSGKNFILVVQKKCAIVIEARVKDRSGFLLFSCLMKRYVK